MMLQAMETAIAGVGGQEDDSDIVIVPVKPQNASKPGRRKPRVSTLMMSRHVLEAAGYHVEVVEQNVRAGKTVFKRDLFGFGDLIGIRRGEVLIVQATTSGNMASRVRKIAESELIGRVREAGIRVVVHGWRAKADKDRASAAQWILRARDLS